MLRRGGLMMCGSGMLCSWEPRMGGLERTRSHKSRWQRRGAGRNQRGKHGQLPYARPRPLSLRPVNMMGNRAPGMRAPRNTNQFLMSEKYQLLKLRSDSVGTECSASSDCEIDPSDMDSYLGVLENAHGALLEPADSGVAGVCCFSPSSPLSPPCWSPFKGGGKCIRALGEKLAPPSQIRGGGTALELSGECSEQYYPSEHDVLESENFMERDFHEFCSKIF